MNNVRRILSVEMIDPIKSISKHSLNNSVGLLIAFIQCRICPILHVMQLVILSIIIYSFTIEG